jgi:hypothetical protein
MRKEWTPAKSEALLERAKAIVRDSKKSNPDRPLTYAEAREIALSEATEVKPTLAFCEPVNLEFAERAKAIVRDSKKSNPDRPLTYAEAREIARAGLEE